MADPVAARLATHVTLMHAGLIAWINAAEHAKAMPVATLEGGVTQSREPDDRMLQLVEGRLERGSDPERLDPVRHHLTHRLGELAGWYVDHTGGVLLDQWEPLAVYLGDLVGDQFAANAIATSVLGHHHLASLTPTPSRGTCQAARERWRRLAERYVRVLDEQPTKGRISQAGRPVVETVGTDDVRRFG